MFLVLRGIRVAFLNKFTFAVDWHVGFSKLSRFFTYSVCEDFEEINSRSSIAIVLTALGFCAQAAAVVQARPGASAAVMGLCGALCCYLETGLVGGGLLDLETSVPCTQCWAAGFLLLVASSFLIYQLWRR